MVGTASLLDAVGFPGSPCAVVVITSDKCYRNDGQVWGFRENDPLGGHDPYSASKAGSELVVDAYRSSFFAVDGSLSMACAWRRPGRERPSAAETGPTTASFLTRFGPWPRGWTLSYGIRFDETLAACPEAVSGYLALARRLLSDDEPARWAGSVNSALPSTTRRPWLTLPLLWSRSGALVVTTMSKAANIEAKTLRISIDRRCRSWRGSRHWRLDETVSRTVQWYRRFYQDPAASMQDHSLEDITTYEASVS